MKTNMKRLKIIKNIILFVLIAVLMAASLIFLVSCGAGVSIGELTVYILTITNNGNGTTVPSGNVQVNHGVATSIEGTPDDTYTFVNWSIINGEGVTFGNAYSASTTVTLTGGDATIQANFYQDVYQLTVTDDGHGSTDPSGNAMVADGVPANITAEPDAGYGFVNWSIESGTGVSFGDANSAVTTVTLTAGDATIQANFTLLPTAVVSPTSGSWLSGSASIVITFSVSMDTITLSLGGDIASESDGGVWSTTTFTDDTLTVKPNSGWSTGSGRTLTVDCDDLAGNSLATLSLSYTVLVYLITINAAGDSFNMGDGEYGAYSGVQTTTVPQTISYHFQMSKYEITNAQFTQFIEDDGYITRSHWTENGWTEKTSGGWKEPAFWFDSSFNGTNQPVVGVSWYEAVAFCNWLSAKEGLTQAYNDSGQATLTASGYRLPTEVEWEYAAAKGASGGAERLWAYTGGFVNPDDWDCTKVVSIVSPCSASQTADVGSKSPSGDTPQGLADMSGNVYEWCGDNYQSDGSVSSGTDRYYFVDDQTSNTFEFRGGSWNFNDEIYFRGAYRNSNSPDNRGSFIGFRVVRP